MNPNQFFNRGRRAATKGENVADMTNQHPSVRHYLLTQWLMLGLALLTVGGVIGYSLIQERIHLETQERNRLLDQARVIDKNMGHQFDSVSLALEGIRNDLPLWRGSAGWRMASRQLTALCDAMPGIRTMLITDAAGTVLAANRSELLGVSFNQRDYFKTPRLRPDSSILYLSGPFRTALGVWALKRDAGNDRATRRVLRRHYGHTRSRILQDALDVGALRAGHVKTSL
jgi:hypothetical protein